MNDPLNKNTKQHLESFCNRLLDRLLDRLLNILFNINTDKLFSVRQVPVSFFIYILFTGNAVSAGTLEVLFTDSDGNPVSDAVIEIISPQIALPDDWDFAGGNGSTRQGVHR